MEPGRPAPHDRSVAVLEFRKALQRLFGGAGEHHLLVLHFGKRPAWTACSQRVMAGRGWGLGVMVSTKGLVDTKVGLVSDGASGSAQVDE